MILLLSPPSRSYNKGHRLRQYEIIQRLTETGQLGVPADRETVGHHKGQYAPTYDVATDSSIHKQRDTYTPIKSIIWSYRYEKKGKRFGCS